MAGARAMIDKARSWIGYREGPGNANRFSAELNRPPESWCADFVAAVARETGNAAYFPNTASCSIGRGWFKQRGRLSVYPAIGAQVFFGAPGNPDGPGGTHTGLCIAYTIDTITVVAGNTNDNGSPNGDGVYLRSYRRRSDYVESYGYPAYPEGLVCADPAWRGRARVIYFGKQADESDVVPARALLAEDLPAQDLPAEDLPAQRADEDQPAGAAEGTAEQES
ncbi:hypothetical protein [Kitasatospora sp. NPDC094015]|uniref:hypothetical protein n=1 Tax=Kitasatospora sp. NPDC094015 TaxID=3155205 RepID=UPI003320E2E9